MKRTLLRFLETIHPGRYRRLNERITKHIIGHYFLILGLALLGFIVLSSIVTIDRADSIDDRLSTLGNLSLTFDGSVRVPTELISRPSIVVDTTTNETSGRITFGEDVVTYRFFGKREIAYDSFRTLSELSPKAQNILALLLLLFLPGLAIVLGVSVVAVSIGVVIFSSLIAYAFLRRQDVKLRTIFYTSVHALQWPTVILLLALPWVSLVWFSFFAYIFLFVLALIIQKDHEFKSFSY